MKSNSKACSTAGMDGTGPTPRERASQARRDRSRQALIGAAVDLVAEQGGSYRVEDIASAAGVSLATLYNHFETKKDLIEAAFARVVDPVVSPICKAADAGAYNPPDPERALVGWIFDVAALLEGHRLLVVELVKAWTDAHLGRMNQTPIAPSLAQTLYRILGTFPDLQGFSFVGSTPSPEAGLIATYHCDMMIIRACVRHVRSSSARVANEVLNQLIPAITSGRKVYSQP